MSFLPEGFALFFMMIEWIIWRTDKCLFLHNNAEFSYFKLCFCTFLCDNLAITIVLFFWKCCSASVQQICLMQFSDPPDIAPDYCLVSHLMGGVGPGLIQWYHNFFFFFKTRVQNNTTCKLNWAFCLGHRCRSWTFNLILKIFPQPV